MGALSKSLALLAALASPLLSTATSISAGPSADPADATELRAARDAQSLPASRWTPLVEEAALRFGLPPDWIWRVMRAESGGQTTLRGRPITSPKGAMGLMQVMPATYAEMARRLGLGTDPYEPRDNILAGAFYLRLMYDRFGYPGLFGAYNSGPARYLAYLAGRQPLPEETRIYLAKVAPGEVGGAAAPGTPAALMAVDARRARRGSDLFHHRSGEPNSTLSSDQPAGAHHVQNPLFVRLQGAGKALP